MANPNAEATPLGFGATAFSSSFDPNEFNQRVGKFEASKAQEKKKKQKAILDNSLASMNPELDKLKWAAPYLNEFEQEFNDFRKKNIDWNVKQNGKLTAGQMAENEIFKLERNAKTELLNTAHKNYTTLKNKVLTDPKWNTPENKEAIKRFGNPYEFDAEKIKEAGGMLEYITQNPIQLTEKPEQFDMLEVVKDIKNVVGVDKTVGGTKIDDVSGEFVNTSTEKFNRQSVQAAASEKYDTDPTVQAQFPNKDDFLRSVNQTLQGTKTTQQRRAGDDDKKVNNVGGAIVTNGLRVTQDEKAIQLSITRDFDENIVTGGLPEGMNKVEAQTIYNESIPTKGWAIADKNDKPITISANVNSVGILTEKGVTKAPGGNFDFKINRVSLIPSTNQDIDIKRLPPSLTKKQLMQRAENGILTKGLTLTKREMNSLKTLGYGDAISDEPYAVGSITDVQEYLDKNKKLIRGVKNIGNTYLVPYKDVKAQITNSGFTIPEQTPQAKGNIGKRLRNKETGEVIVWDNATGKYIKEQ